MRNNKEPTVDDTRSPVIGSVESSDFHYCEYLLEIEEMKSQITARSMVEGHQRIADCPINGWQSVVKRAEDLFIASTVLLLLSPVMLLIAVVIKLDSPGPILFRQQRYGLNNRSFTILKFRTMYVNCCDISGSTRTRRDDLRVSPLGRFLRKYSLDELPQLINILRGEMSMVGPRAHPISMRVGNCLYHEAVSNYAARHCVHPGLTGLAQVNGLRGEIDTLEKARRRVEYDLKYIESWSFALDLNILLKTLMVIIDNKDVY
jgi:polysaccharide biosynthesis protein PslA